MNHPQDADLARAVDLLNAGRKLEAVALCHDILQSGDQESPLNLIAVVRLHDGDLRGASDCYRRIVAINPRSFEALDNLGLVLTWQKQYPAAIECFKRALAIRPDRAETHNNLGNVFLAQRQYPAAITSFRKAATIAPHSAESHFNVGVASAAIGRLENAMAAYRAALAAEPDFVWALNNLAICLRAGGRFEEAAAALRRAVGLKPDFAQGHNNLGNALASLDDREGAIASFRRALELDPDLADAHFNLANALASEHQYLAALPHYERAITVRPSHAEAHNNLGNALAELRRHEAAVSEFRAALEIKPDLFEAHLNLANALSSLRRHEDAKSSYELSLAIRPGDPEANNGLGNALVSLERYDEAIAAFGQTLAADPVHPNALGVAAYLRRQISDWTDSVPHEEVLFAHVRDGAVTIAPFMFLAITDDPGLQFACSRKYWASLKVKTAARATPRARARDRLRIGYISGNFRAHATTYLTSQLFELHDRGKFEVFGLSYGPDENSDARRRVKQGFDHFVDLRRCSDDEMEDHIRNAELDILIDLKGYQQNTRIDVLARRPAPVQVHYICHPGTLGVDFIDYIFVDRFLVPPEEEAHYSEKLVFLPDSYLVTDQKRAIGPAPSRAQCGLPARGFVFCCFNNTYKITPAIFDIWMRLLKAVPGSVLWLIADNRWAEANLRREAAARGVAPDRLVFAPRLRLDEHLARHRLADLFVDTWPYCAHTTATDALWAGLPLLTLTGRSFASRVAGSLLRAAGLPELIVDNTADYERLALRLAGDPDLLAGFRARLTGDLTRLPAFDTPRIVGHIEAAYEEMWRRHQRGEAPASFAVQRTTSR